VVLFSTRRSPARNSRAFPWSTTFDVWPHSKYFDVGFSVQKKNALGNAVSVLLEIFAGLQYTPSVFICKHREVESRKDTRFLCLRRIFWALNIWPWCLLNYEPPMIPGKGVGHRPGLEFRVLPELQPVLGLRGSECSLSSPSKPLHPPLLASARVRGVRRSAGAGGKQRGCSRASTSASAYPPPRICIFPRETLP